MSSVAQARRLTEAVGQLDDLHSALVAIDASRPWSAHDWIVESTPLRMRLPDVERGLAILRDLDLVSWPDTAWALEFDEASAHIEKALEQLLIVLAPLLEGDYSAEERARLSRQFRSRAESVLDGVRRLRDLVADCYSSADWE